MALITTPILFVLAVEFFISTWQFLSVEGVAFLHLKANTSFKSGSKTGLPSIGEF
jgi:hypothetical protein